MGWFDILVGVCTIISAVVSIFTLKTVSDIRHDTRITNSGKNNRTNVTDNSGSAGRDIIQNTVGGDQITDSTINK